jgi:tyrosine-protein kinase Etk/Wzc
MQQTPTQPTPLRELDFGYIISHYLNLLWRWKLWIVIAAPLSIVVVMAGLYRVGSVKPELDATVMIGLESSGSKSAVGDIGESDQMNRMALVKAKGFLSEIVDKLSIRLQVNKYSLHEVFDSVDIESNAPAASYSLSIEKNTYTIKCSSAALGIKKKIVENGSIVNLQKISLAGVTCTFTDQFLKKPFPFDWIIIRKRDAISLLEKSLTVYDRDLREARGRGENVVKISISGRDYRRITKIINTIADEFVKKNLGFKKRKTNETLNVLEKQLQAASDEVTTTQEAVRGFRNAHPNVSLANELQSSVANIALMETSVYTSRTSAQEAQNLYSQLSSASEPDQDNFINEALMFLSRQGLVAASVLQTEFTTLLQQKTALSIGYSKTHPQVLENRSKITAIRNRTLTLVQEFIKNTTTNTLQQSNKIQEITYKLQGLPTLQQQLAELQRKAQVAAQIHSTVLERFNQAKISDAVEMPDVYVMDYAIEPEYTYKLQDLAKTYGIGLIFIILCTFGLPFASDLLDRTARTETELIKLLPYAFLESIPVIFATNNSTGQKKDSNARPQTNLRLIDPKLVTAAYTPDFTNEIFRSLRSKLLLRMHDHTCKRLMITSFGINEGKSLLSANLAITMAQSKLKTLLIDGDIRRGVQHNTFALSKKPGLADFLFSDDSEPLTTLNQLVQPTHVPNLSLLASGPNVPNPSELLGQPKFTQMLDLFSSQYDVIIIDTPPVGVAVDAAIMCNLFHGVILTIKAGSTDVVSLKKRLNEFANLHKNIIGMILNQAKLDSTMKKYKYYSYNY